MTHRDGASWIKAGHSGYSWMRLARYLVGDNAKDKVVIHLNNDCRDDRIENLACIDRKTAHYMMTHGFYSKNSEITKTGVMLCELMQALKDQEKGETNGGNTKT